MENWTLKQPFVSLNLILHKCITYSVWIFSNTINKLIVKSLRALKIETNFVVHWSILMKSSLILSLTRLSSTTHCSLKILWFEKSYISVSDVNLIIFSWLSSFDCFHSVFLFFEFTTLTVILCICIVELFS